jgi:elongation factor G
MQVETPDKIRNLAIAGHSDTGKTTLVSSLLHASGVVNRMNRVEDGNTVTDYDAEEIERGISIGLAVVHLPWKQHKLNLIDCPGYSIFFAETRSAARAADAILLCINAVSGLEVTSEKTWTVANEWKLPVLIHLTKMDRERADFEGDLGKLQQALGREVVALQVPVGKEHDFSGVIDLLSEKFYSYEPNGDGKAKGRPVPEELKEEMATWRERFVEAVAETDDELLEKYFEEGTLEVDELRAALRRAVQARKIVPVTMSSAAHGIGPSALLDHVVDVAPAPTDRELFPATNIAGEPVEVKTSTDEPASALVFKTLSDPFTGKVSLIRVVSGTVTTDSHPWNSRTDVEERTTNLMLVEGKQGRATPQLVAGDIGGVAKLKQAATGDTLADKDRPVVLAWMPKREDAISFAIEPKSKGDEEKIGEALGRLKEEDITLHAHRDPETGEFLLSGTGQLHVEIAVAKLKKRFNVEVILHPPKVPYREAIRKPADGHGRHKKQTGGRGQFADCRIKVEPLTDGQEFEFVDEIFGGSIPQGYRPAVEKGIQEARRRGYLAGYPVSGFRVRLLDGQHHDVDSSEMAFKVAGSLAFKDAMSKAAVTIHEPYMKVDITTSEEFTGDIMSDLAQRRGRPQGMETRGHNQVVTAAVPLAEMLTYAPALTAMTQGRASFHMEFSHYEEAPRPVQEKIIAEAQREKEEGG